MGYHHKATKWSVENVHSKNVVAILQLLVALVRHFRAPIRLPENVSVKVVCVEKNDDKLETKYTNNSYIISSKIKFKYFFLELMMNKSQLNTMMLV